MIGGRSAIATIAISVAVLASCSGGSGGGVIADPVAAGFAPAAPAPAAASVTLQAGAAADDVIEVDVVLTDVAGVFSLAFDVVFDASHASYAGAIEGDFLSSGATDTEFLVTAAPGRLIVGLSRIQDGANGVPDVDAVGSRVAATLRFRVLRPGASGLDFDPTAPRSVRTRDGILVPTSWTGGSLTGI
jgi:hypothetical protein